MAIIPNPVPGQPLDYSYINAIVNQTNRLTTSFSSSNTPAVINGTTPPKMPLIVTAQSPFAVTVDKGKSDSTISIEFGKAFGDVPTVTVSAAPNDKNKAFTVTLDTVTKTGVKIMITNVGSVKDTFSGTVHVIAIGIPVG